MWRALTLLAAVFLVAFGAVVVRAGDLDDSPGLGGLGLVTAVIGQPTYEIGRSAIELLLARIAQPEQAQRRIMLRGELLIRGSSRNRH